ncbi:hypothetical protein ACSLM9_25895, partial [Escherichia coli]
MCNKTTPDAAAAALTTLMHALIDISVIAASAQITSIWWARSAACCSVISWLISLPPDEYGQQIPSRSQP